MSPSKKSTTTRIPNPKVPFMKIDATIIRGITMGASLISSADHDVSVRLSHVDLRRKLGR